MTPEPPDDTLANALRASRRLEDAPEALIQRAIHLYTVQAAPVTAASPGLLQRLVAAVSFDSAAASALALGLRSSAAQTRQLLYTAEGRDVDLRVAASVDGRVFVISGQVLGPDEAGVAVLVSAGQELSATWNELSEFSFAPIGPGPCALTLRAAGWVLELPPLVVGGQD
jgi:hypothetical protein